MVPAVRGCHLRKVSVAEPIPVWDGSLLRRAAQPGDGAAAVGREGGAEAAGPPARGVGGGFASPARPGAGSTHPDGFETFSGFGGPPLQLFNEAGEGIARCGL